ncbi:MAG: hypothetical protein MJZ22_01955, partial [Candidatus Saccharibacteria bacterium]|nr:hypothetical protein [Candidatus Saccharibacteria bacterium]
MLDINFIRENLDLVEKSANEKGYKVNFSDLLKLDDDRKSVLKEVEDLRRERNEIASQMKGGRPDPSLIERGKAVKEQLAGLEDRLSLAESSLKASLKTIPNIILEDVPLGGEECSVEVASWGGQKSADEGVDHLDYAIPRDRVDFER